MPRKSGFKARGLEAQVWVRQGDYHRLDELYPAEAFDVVYFLESFGHSHDQQKLFEAACRVLKPGGTL